MSTPAGGSRIALVADRHGPDASRLAAFLAPEEQARADWFNPDHLAELDRQVQRGAHVRRVVFNNAADLLSGIWDGEVELGAWMENGIQIDFVESGPSGLTREALLQVHQSWTRWNQRHRRRQLVAGAILSTVVIITCFLLNLVWPSRSF